MFQNLTPHAVKVGQTTFLPSGQVARCATTMVPCGTHLGVELYKSVVGDVVGLPTETEGTFLIVSAMVRCALPNRKDLVSPGNLVRDSSGNVIGCDGFITNM